MAMRHIFTQELKLEHFRTCPKLNYDLQACHI